MGSRRWGVLVGTLLLIGLTGWGALRHAHIRHARHEEG